MSRGMTPLAFLRYIQARRCPLGRRPAGPSSRFVSRYHFILGGSPMTTPASAHGCTLAARLAVALLTLTVAGLAPFAPAAAQSTPEPPQPPPLVFEDETGPPPDPVPPHRFHLGVELDTNFRNSSDYVFDTHYPGLSPAASR